ncbi:Protein of unknown function (DUF3527 [Striga hermonthica]|uniref:Reverse transcriptase zinc-binding domain-containing protein n=1 Tax=Striga hermonthica TaxID=68872 RepID=A0A9N7NCN7_STRHE|nr:Protein of unknown function (DUF3527 [Striga hermonthica]
MDLDFDKYCLVDRQSPTTVLSKTTIKGTSVERKKIELSQQNAPCGFSFEIIDSLCTSDEDRPIVTSLSGKGTSVCSHNIDSGSWASMVPTESVGGAVMSASNGPQIKSRFKPVKKMFDPFVKSKLQRSPSSNSNKRTNEGKENMQSSSSSIAHLHGLLKLGKRRGGVPFFEFSVKSSPDDFYLAKIERAEYGFNWVYTFHSLHKGGKKTSHKNNGNRALSHNMLAQMHVSCNPCENFVMTEFVLYEIKNNSCENNNARFEYSPELEIVAVVVKARLGKKTEEGIFGISRPPAETHVLVPGGAHGSPAGGDRPSRLIDRWRLGGGCDCGGWDMACPIDVFSCPNNALLVDGRNISTELFFQGKKDIFLPAFAMKVRTGEEGKLYDVDFHARLSSLQAFSICVAVLHAQVEASGRMTAGGQFTTRSAYSSLTPDVFPVNRRLWKMIWSWVGPQRIHQFLWLAAKDRLLTNSERYRRHLATSPLCELCRSHPETTLHVLRDCEFSTKFWKKVVPRFC